MSDDCPDSDPDSVPNGGDGASAPSPPDPPPFPPFEVERSERIYNSWWVGLRRDLLRLPGGGTQEHHVVEISDAVCVVPVTERGNVVLVGQHRHPHGKTHWELPAGRLEDGEDPARGARRELLEETGYSCPGDLQPLPGFYPTNGISAHWAHLFLASGCRRVQDQDLDPAERMVVREFTPGEVERMLREGRFEDGFTAIGLMYARLLGPRAGSADSG